MAQHRPDYNAGNNALKQQEGEERLHVKPLKDGLKEGIATAQTKELGDMDKIKPERNDYIRYVPQKTRPEYVIAIGIIIGALLSASVWIAYIEYNKYEAEQALEAWSQQEQKQAAEANAAEKIKIEAAQIRMERLKEKWKQQRIDRMLKTEQGLDQIRDRQVAQQKAAEKAVNCHYWKKKEQERDTQGNRVMVANYCK